MVEYRPLDFVIDEGTVYYTPKRAAFIVRKIGTNSTSAAKLIVRTTELGEVDSTVAPMSKTGSNTLGPLDLGDYYYVIPPETPFQFSGTGASVMRLIGEIVLLAPGEAIPRELMDRYNEQGKVYKTLVSDSGSLGTDVALPADGELEILSLTPSAIESYTFNGPVMVSVSNYTPSWGDIALRFWLLNRYLDELTIPPGSDTGGIDVLACPSPPDTTDGMEPFSLEQHPIEVGPNIPFKVYARNVSGADISPAAGTALSIAIKTVAVYRREG